MGGASSYVDGVQDKIQVNGTFTTYHVNVQKISFRHNSVAEKLQEE